MRERGYLWEEPQVVLVTVSGPMQLGFLERAGRGARRREGVTPHGCLPFFFFLPYYEDMQLSNIL